MLRVAPSSTHSSVAVAAIAGHSTANGNPIKVRQRRVRPLRPIASGTRGIDCTAVKRPEPWPSVLP
eukprot:11444275-Alexandrium_andersonii.AAC.1